MSGVRPVVIVGGVRTPFCRAYSAYDELSNLDMLSTVLQGLSERYELKQQLIDEVVAGAVLKHTKDWNLAREAVLSSDLSPETPAVTLQQACGTSLQALAMSAAKIACGQIECAIAAGTDTVSDVPLTFGKKIAKRFVRLSRARDFGSKLRTFKGFSLRELTPQPPSSGEPRTLLSMGEHCELMAKTWGITRAQQDAFALASHQKAAAAYTSGFFDDQLVSCAGVLRDNNLRADASMAALESLKPAYDRSGQGTLTAGNSTPLTDGAAGVLLCSEDWAKARGLPIIAYLTDVQHAALDFVAGKGLLMAPTKAVARLLQRQQLSLQDFDLYEIHEAFAAQVLCTLRAWESDEYCREELQMDQALGTIAPEKINPVGSSLAVGHPFAATGARVTMTLAKQLEQRGQGRGLISVCTAGGMGIAAILER